MVDEAIGISPGKAQTPRKSYDISKIDFNRLREEFARSEKKNTVVQSLKMVIENKLERLMQRNPLRTNFQEHYEKIVEEYNKEKDRQNIEAIFAELLQFVQGLDQEENRAIREELDEETLAIYDLLVKPELKPQEIRKIKKVAKNLLKELKTKLAKFYKWQDREPMRDEVKTIIKDFLWDDKTGLPIECYSINDVEKKAEEVFYHFHRAYPEIPSPYYETVA